MSCCGQKREAWRRSTLPSAEAVAPPPPPPQNPVAVRHLGASSLLVKGAVSGQAYLFAGAASSLLVDERDLAALIATGRFAIVGAG